MVREDEETGLPPVFFGCTQEKNSNCLDFLAPEFLSLVGDGEIGMRDIESIHRIFAEFVAEDNLRANQKDGTVIEEVS